MPGSGETGESQEGSLGLGRALSFFEEAPGGGEERGSPAAPEDELSKELDCGKEAISSEA